MKEEKETTKEETKVKALRIKNGNIEKLIDFLDTPLHSQEARSRNNFVTVLGKQLVYIGKERIKLLEEHSEKDKDNKPKMSIT